MPRAEGGPRGPGSGYRREAVGPSSIPFLRRPAERNAEVTTMAVQRARDDDGGLRREEPVRPERGLTGDLGFWLLAHSVFAVFGAWRSAATGWFRRGAGSFALAAASEAVAGFRRKISACRWTSRGCRASCSPSSSGSRAPSTSSKRAFAREKTGGRRHFARAAHAAGRLADHDRGGACASRAHPNEYREILQRLPRHRPADEPDGGTTADPGPPRCRRRCLRPRLSTWRQLDRAVHGPGSAAGRGQGPDAANSTATARIVHARPTRTSSARSSPICCTTPSPTTGRTAAIDVAVRARTAKLARSERHGHRHQSRGPGAHLRSLLSRRFAPGTPKDCTPAWACPSSRATST